MVYLSTKRNQIIPYNQWKSKEQTRKLAANCSKHWGFEVSDRANVVGRDFRRVLKTKMTMLNNRKEIKMKDGKSKPNIIKCYNEQK